ncbi:tRNA uridine-5-carboxymethylaminomethyl(34) synthesis GTPase MnmE [Zongyangia hominis]|uniref:tRNA modification GTPase MnmE n=1 Tax=Zongyangia hominis TaxID=2763677 RepID=A0A926IBX8_9FIRM|nr:tRNA uridine-5-carboxymethylaminomethyl(34) synthesis GTPase MnmE [Zongyangia hominis]MBC8570647.1 tRNA uridine-5-carboxymethylaminomethyl(34) synthesis GTPase MnmE [Zongyangia hominis]
METATIAAIATPLGVGGIGTIRVSGPGAREITARVFRSALGDDLRKMEGYRATFGHVFDEAGEFDEAVVLLFAAPRSFTGEDVAEISCHGGVYLLERLLSALVRAGARPAQAGEFTKRAFLNGKLDLTRAEAVADLIGAQGRQAAASALAAKEGALYRKSREICDSLVALASHLSAWIDYPEEDVEDVEGESLLSELTAIGEGLTALSATFETGHLLREGIPTAIVGRPNVGKSTIMNMLSGTQNSIVTPIPGTTRDVVEDQVAVDGMVLRLADTAGIRDTDDPVERLGVERARARIDQAALVLAVFDASEALTDDDRSIIAQCGEKPAIAVINKRDLEQKIDETYIKDKFKHIVYTSAQMGEGQQELSAAIRRVMRLEHLDPSAPMVANERQRDCVLRAGAAVESAVEALRMAFTLDAVDVCVEDAISCLMELTGERASEAVVEQVFSRFCVGK